MHFSSDICGTLKHFKSLQQDWVVCGWGYLFPQVTSEQNLQELRLGPTVPPPPFPPGKGLLTFAHKATVQPEHPEEAENVLL